MRKFFVLLLAGLFLLSLMGCSAAAPAETEPEPTQAPTETTVATEPPPAEGFLFLTVSEITLSVVGDSEDIYTGTIPRELVTWGSEDEAVVTFRDGILTATGVGSTTVYAEYNGQRLEAKAGCLAQSQEELLTLDREVLRSPKRYPPIPEGDTIPYFADAAIIGDSISYILFQYETQLGHLGKPLFLARGGTSLNGFVRYYKNIYYKGQPADLEDAIAQSGVGKAFFMLGQNDLGYRTIEDTLSSWDILLERIWEQSPDVEIYLQSCVPEWISETENNAKNDKIDEYNILLEEYAQEHGCHFVDIAPYAEDHLNRMASVYSMDQGIHMNETGCIMWMQVLNAYAQREMLLGGTN